MWKERRCEKNNNKKDEKAPTSSSWVSTGVEIFPPDIHVRTGEDRDVGDVTSQVLVLAVRVDV